MCEYVPVNFLFLHANIFSNMLPYLLESATNPLAHPETPMLATIQQELRLQQEERQLAGMVPGQVSCGKAGLPQYSGEDI